MATPLDQLAAALVRGHERAKKNAKSASFQVDPIDDAVDELASLVTKVRPHRDRVLEDLALFLRGTLPSGYAMEVRTILREATPWETWERTVHPFVLELRWSPSMENQQRESSHFIVERIAKEDGEWKIVAFYDEPRRAKAKLEAEMRAKAERG